MIMDWEPLTQGITWDPRHQNSKVNTCATWSEAPALELNWLPGLPGSHQVWLGGGVGGSSEVTQLSWAHKGRTKPVLGEERKEGRRVLTRALPFLEFYEEALPFPISPSPPSASMEETS